MAKYSLQIGVGGIGDDPLLSVQHSVDFHAEDDSSAVAQTIQTIEADNAYMAPSELSSSPKTAVSYGSVLQVVKIAARIYYFGHPTRLPHTAAIY
ncbi:hypothetical protein AAIH70_29980 [Neorhizobium sp. BT27B]|uniref:hypothetical protein n=1 Tax=Neorhizobium sp. BT27B TaxID=3142625 RepID=UPI003D2E7C68